jgi:hypothetical protein
MPRIKLTDLGIRAMKLPPHGQQLDISDAHTPGLNFARELRRGESVESYLI